MATEVRSLEWSLNKQTLRADVGEKEVEELSAQGRNTYAKLNKLERNPKREYLKWKLSCKRKWKMWLH